MLSNIWTSVSKFTINTLTSILQKGGTIPKKIAFIMDGNRRYANKLQVKRIQGHTDGMRTLLDIMQWSIDFGVEEVTVFAFSVDNFNRSKEEVDSLLLLFKQNFQNFSQSPEAEKLRIQICIYGNWSFFPEDIQLIFKEIEDKTKHYNKIKLNVCIGYNSTEEINHVRCEYMKHKEHKCNNNNNNNNDVYINEFDSCLYGKYNCNPDLLLRTSGETRLSNFLLYQCRFAVIMFVEKYWPEISFCDYFKMLIKYNYNYSKHVQKIRELEKENNFNILNNKE